MVTSQLSMLKTNCFWFSRLPTQPCNQIQTLYFLDKMDKSYIQFWLHFHGHLSKNINIYMHIYLKAKRTPIKMAALLE